MTSIHIHQTEVVLHPRLRGQRKLTKGTEESRERDQIPRSLYLRQREANLHHRMDEKSRDTDRKRALKKRGINRDTELAEVGRNSHFT